MSIEAKVSILIPFYESDEWRGKALEYVKRWWKENFPESQGIVGRADPFTKGAAAHEAASRASGDIFIIADADCFMFDPYDVYSVVELIAKGEYHWSMPHNFVHRTTKEATEEIYATGKVNIHDVQYPVYGGCEGGGMTILTREAWNTVEGIDPHFQGWGGEDRAFGFALQALVPGRHKGNGRLVHLWHPVQGPRRALSPDTMKRIGAYQRARRSPSAMRALIDSRGEI